MAAVAAAGKNLDVFGLFWMFSVFSDVFVIFGCFRVFLSVFERFWTFLELRRLRRAVRCGFVGFRGRDVT